jgi:predicted nuclease of predicted toxin-antitoxin system
MSRFKIDENLPHEFVDILNENGHDALSVYQQKLSGKPDSQIADICKKENRIIITLDIGFSDIRNFPPSDYPGILVIRSNEQDKITLINILNTVIPKLNVTEIKNHLWIIDKDKIRIRK